jgi:hypothetical protein
MTIDEIKSLIRYQIPKSDQAPVAIAEIRLQAWFHLPQNGPAEAYEIAAIKEELEAQLLAKLYDDQRKNLYDALIKLKTASPFDGSMEKAINAVLVAAQYQPPK